MESRTRDLRVGYVAVAADYAERIYGELAHKPFDRELLDRFAEQVRPLGPVCDLGCGPAHVGRYLQECGLSVLGIDLSREMVVQARRLNAGLELCQGSMPAMPLRDASLGGIVAFYSVIHVPRAHLPQALAEMRRALQPGGALALAFHLGEQDLHMAEWWGHHVSVDFFFFTRAEIERHLTDTGFDITESLERPPYPDVEHQSQRAYVVARRPAEAVNRTAAPSG